MSKLFYKIPLEEEYDIENKNISAYQLIGKNLPHFEQIKNWLPKEWDKCEIHKWFDGILKDKVKCTKMDVEQDSDGYAYAIITIEFVDGFRLSEKRRNACWEYLDGQMSDGFGESYDKHQIPNAPEGWGISF